MQASETRVQPLYSLLDSVTKNGRGMENVDCCPGTVVLDPSICKTSRQILNWKSHKLYPAPYCPSAPWSLPCVSGQFCLVLWVAHNDGD